MATSKTSAPRTRATKRASTATTASSEPRHGQRAAAHRAVARSNIDIRLPLVGEVVLPEPAHLAWYAGVAALAALEIIEWPIAVVLAVGKALADDHGNEALEEFGQALEEGG